MSQVNIALLQAAIEHIEEIPEERIDLDRFYDSYSRSRGTVSCNTVACAAGWLMLDARFLPPGVQRYHSTSPLFYTSEGITFDAYSAMATVFGLTLRQSRSLFAPYRRATKSSDKTIWLRRARRLLNKHIALEQAEQALAKAASVAPVEELA